jgi:hypothetical protein
MKVIVILCIVFGFFSAQVSALSLQTEGQVSLSKDQEENKSIERIEVYGKKPTRFYYREYIKAEENFVALFNQLSQERDFFVRCGFRNKYGSKIKGRFCEPRYTPRLQGYARVFQKSKKWLAEEIEKKRLEQVNYTQALIEDSPELLQALVNYTNARKAYNKKRSEARLFAKK